MDQDQIKEKLKRVAEHCREEMKGKQGYFFCGRVYTWDKETGGMMSMVDYNGPGDYMDLSNKAITADEYFGDGWSAIRKYLNIPEGKYTPV